MIKPALQMFCIAVLVLCNDVKKPDENQQVTLIGFCFAIIPFRYLKNHRLTSDKRRRRSNDILNFKAICFRDGAAHLAKDIKNIFCGIKLLGLFFRKCSIYLWLFNNAQYRHHHSEFIRHIIDGRLFMKQLPFHIGRAFTSQLFQQSFVCNFFFLTAVYDAIA